MKSHKTKQDEKKVVTHHLQHFSFNLSHLLSTSYMANLIGNVGEAFLCQQCNNNDNSNYENSWFI